MTLYAMNILSTIRFFLLNIFLQSWIKLIDASINDINGGSIALTATHADSSFSHNSPYLNWLIQSEKRSNLNTISPYLGFAQSVKSHKEDLLLLLDSIKKSEKTIAGYASTKGNVLLQYCGIDSRYLDFILEVNPDKFNSFTPGTSIPIL